MIRKLFLLLFPTLLTALDIKPWYTPLAEFQFVPSYTYSYYPDVNNAINPTSYSSNNHTPAAYIGLTFLPNWNLQLEGEWTSTRKLSFTTRSAALQIRHLLLDDIQGDPISLSLGLAYRYVPSKALTDVSTPYHKRSNFEIHCALGKEFANLTMWNTRFYTALALGQANKGSPYLLPQLVFQVNASNKHHLGLFGEAYIGFGNRDTINIRRFRGYADIGHRSIDLGLLYTYLFDIWGDITFSYAYRPYAHSYPERQSKFFIEYRLPFSVL